MSAVSSSLITQPGALGADAFRPAVTGQVTGDVAGRSWFHDWGSDSPTSSSPPVLHADVEAQAKGLSADQHAERVLSHLVEGR